MTTPGAVRTKLWRSVNQDRYRKYMAEYMRKKREAKKIAESAGQEVTSPVPPPAEVAPDHADPQGEK